MKATRLLLDKSIIFGLEDSDMSNDPVEQETQDQLLESINLKVKREKASIISLLGSKGIAIGEPIWLNVRPRRRRHYYKWLLTAILDSSQLTYSNKEEY